MTRGGQTLTYAYDALGTKHRYVADTFTVKYAGAFEYNQNNALSRIATTEGQLAARGDTLRFEYYLKDHLGNVRLVFDEKGKILQQNDYYPFGLEIDRNTPVQTLAARNGTNRYNFLGKETQVGTGYIDLSRRFYDPAIGRFMQVDPLAEQMASWSPYNYTFNNPIKFVDPLGLAPFDFVQKGDGSIYWDKNANDKASTKSGETYLGASLNFTFTSNIDAKLWDGPMGSFPAGDKLVSTVNVTGNEDSNGNLTSIDVKSGKPDIKATGGIFQGVGSFPGQTNTSVDKKGMTGGTATYEQHAMVNGFEAMGLGLMNYDVVNVAQKLTIGISGNNLSVTAATDIFPSANLSVNGSRLFNYSQPSFKATHGRDTRTVIGDGGTGTSTMSVSTPRRPAPSFIIRYKR